MQGRPRARVHFVEFTEKTMNTYAIDFESSFSKDHSTEIHGTLNYLSHPATDLYLMSVAGDDGFRWSGRPEDFNWHLFRNARVIAHNASFDLGIYDAWGRRGHPSLPRPGDFNCTAHLAGYLGAPQNLAEASEKLLGEALSKEPRKKMKGREWATIPDEEKAEIIAYNARDAELCLKLWERYATRWPAPEQALSRQTIEISHRGVRVDAHRLEESIAIASEIREQSLIGIPWALDRPPLSLPAARAHCARVGILPPDSFAEKSEACAIWEARFGDAHAFVRSLRDFRKANMLLRKLQAMRRRIMPCGRVNYDLRYAGAHTLRWSGMGGLNMQNLAREPWNGIYLRGLLIPEPEKKFIICDLSQIEPRVLAWIAEDDALLTAIRSGLGFYDAHAVSWGMWDPSRGPLKDKNPSLYLYIKSLSLGCGYGMGWIRFRSICAQRGITFSAAEAQNRVAQYRAKNPKVTALWRRLDHELHLQRRHGKARLSLPSGRALVYPNLGWEKGGLWADLQTSEGTRRVKIWGGFVTENAVQSIARDIFAEGLLAVEAAGLQVVLHSHDEVVVEADLDVPCQEVIRLMTQCPDWIKGLPLDAEAKEGLTYVK
jgi:DNA polymerase I-like protein with 3'-5' exonuclease and polymerase domains